MVQPGMFVSLLLEIDLDLSEGLLICLGAQITLKIIEYNWCYFSE